MNRIKSGSSSNSSASRSSLVQAVPRSSLVQAVPRSSLVQSVPRSSLVQAVPRSSLVQMTSGLSSGQSAYMLNLGEKSSVSSSSHMTSRSSLDQTASPSVGSMASKSSVGRANLNSQASQALNFSTGHIVSQRNCELTSQTPKTVAHQFKYFDRQNFSRTQNLKMPVNFCPDAKPINCRNKSPSLTLTSEQNDHSPDNPLKNTAPSPSANSSTTCTAASSIPKFDDRDMKCSVNDEKDSVPPSENCALDLKLPTNDSVAASSSQQRSPHSSQTRTNSDASHVIISQEEKAGVVVNDRYYALIETTMRKDGKICVSHSYQPSEKPT